MSDRRAERGVAPRLVALVALALVTSAIAVVLTWVSSDLQIQVNAFYSSQTEQVSQEEYDRWNVISTNAYTFVQLATPLLLGAMGALFGLLAVLAFRWERRKGPGQATAASRV
jgi:membrane associated rhomboid family serine protease